MFSGDRSSLHIHAGLCLHCRMIFRDLLSLAHDLDQIHTPVIDRSVLTDLWFFTEITVKFILIIAVCSIYRLCSYRDPHITFINSGIQ